MELNRRKRKLLEKLSRSSFAFAGTELIRELLRGETDKVGENFYHSLTSDGTGFQKNLQTWQGSDYFD